MEFTVVIQKAEEGGFWAEVPALPGCYSQGETVEETMENIREGAGCSPGGRPDHRQGPGLRKRGMSRAFRPGELPRSTIL